MSEEPLGERVKALETIVPEIKEDVAQINSKLDRLNEVSNKQKGAMAVLGGFAGYAATWLHKVWPGA